MPVRRIACVLLHLCAVLAAGCSLLVKFDPPPADQQHPELLAPRSETLFSHPAVDGTLDDAADLRIGKLIDAAVSGSTIRVAVGALSQSELAAKLVAAHQRGVTVTIIAEDCPTQDSNGICTSSASDVLQSLRSQLPAGSVLFCHRGCLGTGGNHQQFWLFSELDDQSTNVLAQVSGPLGPDQDGLHNNLFIRFNDGTLASAYGAVFDRMKASSPGTFADATTSGDGGTLTVWFSPRESGADQTTYGSSDLIAAAIQQVVCQDSTGLPGIIRMTVSEWSSDRPEVAQALMAKKQEGCSVEVLLRGGANAEATAYPLAVPEIPVRIFRPGACRALVNPPAGGSCQVGGLTSNTVLLESAGGTHQSVLISSVGWTAAALQSEDSALLRMADSAVYQAFVDEFQRMDEEALKVLPTRYPNAAPRLIPKDSSKNERHSAIATNDAGYMAIAWEVAPSSGETTTGTQINLQLFKDDALLFETTVSDGSGGTTNTTWSHVEPDVGLDAVGNAYVVWSSDSDGNGFYEIGFRKVSPDGTLGPIVNANSPASNGQQYHSSIAVRPDGSCTVVFEDSYNAVVAIRATGLDGAGQKVYNSAQVSPTTASPSTNKYPDAATSSQGNTYVVWEEDTNGDGKANIALAALSLSGVATGMPLVNTLIADAKRPAIAMAPDGTFAVAWSGNASGDYRIHLRGFTSAASERFAEQEVLAGVQVFDPLIGIQSAPDVAMDSTGRLMVVWEELDPSISQRGLEIYARGFNADGTTAGAFPPTRMGSILFNDQHEPAIILLPTGEFRIAFTDDYNGNSYGDVWLRSGFTNN